MSATSGHQSDKFRALAEEAAPLQFRLDNIRLEMMKQAQQMTTEIVREAFPKAEFLSLRVVSEVRPSDFAKSAHEAVRLLRENNVTPTIIIVDEARCTVLLAIEATPEKTKTKRSTRKPTLGQ